MDILVVSNELEFEAKQDMILDMFEVNDFELENPAELWIKAGTKIEVTVCEVEFDYIGIELPESKIAFLRRSEIGEVFDLKEVVFCTCGNCGKVMTYTYGSEEAKCPHCNFESDVADFPDLQ
jgi:LSD1 subclass zinc finger protein